MARFSKAFDECISILLGEIELAFTWDRPSVLLAVSKSKTVQMKAMKTLENRLSQLPRKVVNLSPDLEHPDILKLILQESNLEEKVFFVDELGSNESVYQALNIHRETFIEKRIKSLFWVTEHEAAYLPNLAPDFWAFRHRVIEFAPSRGTPNRALPAGVLMWHMENNFLDLELVDEKILFQENLLRELPDAKEAIAPHAEAVYMLASLSWFKGELSKAEELLLLELKKTEPLGILELESKMLNGLAIIYYDLGRTDQALQLMEKAINRDLENVILLANLGVIYHAQGLGRLSIRSFERSIHLSPGISWLWNMLGYVHLVNGKLDKALFSFEKALSLNEEDFRTQCAIAVCHLRMNSPEKAERTASSLNGQSTYHSICLEGLFGKRFVAERRLKSALTHGEIPSDFVRHDITLNIIFGGKVLVSLLN